MATPFYFIVVFATLITLFNSNSASANEYEQCLPFLEADLEFQQGLNSLYESDYRTALFVDQADAYGFDIWSASSHEIEQHMREYPGLNLSTQDVIEWRNQYTELTSRWYQYVDSVWTGARSDNPEVQWNLYISITEQCQFRYGN